MNVFITFIVETEENKNTTGRFFERYEYDDEKPAEIADRLKRLLDTECDFENL